MDKKFFEMMNDVEIELNEYEIEEISDLNKKKYKKKFRGSIREHRKIKKITKIAAVAAGIMIIATVGLLQTSGGQVVLAEVGRYLGLRGNYKTENAVDLGSSTSNGYTINGSVEKDGLKITLKEYIRDNNLLNIVYMIEGNEIEGEVSERYAIDWDVYINNKKVEARYGNFYERVEGIYKSGRGPVIELNGLELGDTYNVKVDMHKMDYVAYVFDDNGDPIGFRAVLESKEKVGTLEFVVNNNAYEEEIKYIPINKEYEIENGDKFTLDKFSSTVAGKKFYYKSDFKQKNIYGTQRTIMLLDITDEYGNEVLGHIPGEAKSEGDIRIVDRGDHNEKTDEGKVMMIDEKAKILNVKVKVAILPKELGDNFEEWKVIDEFKLDLSELE